MKNILILGATSDIAQATAKKFAAEGWNLTLAARNMELLEPVAGDLQVRTTVEVSVVEFDAEKFETHSEFYAGLPVKPDAVVCVFGYMGDQQEARSNLAEVRKTINVNYTGAVSILNVVADEFEKKAGGSIIGISSVAGDRGRQSNYIYGSAKAGFTAYLSGLRNRLFKSGVHVMTVKPGFCRTRMTENMDLPATLLAEPEQVAASIFHGLENKKDVVYSLWIWRWIMLAVKLVPESIFKRLGM